MHRRVKRIIASGGRPPSLPQGIPSRSSRPGQPPPIKNSSSGCNVSSSSKRARQGPREGGHAEDAARKHAAWSAARPSMQGSYMVFTQHRALLRHEQMQLELRARQHQLSGAWQQHACCGSVEHEESESGHCCAMELPPCLELLEERTAKYISLRAIGSVTIPKWRCSQCNLSFHPDFLAFDLFPGTPSFPETLYHMEVLEDYEHLGLRGGVSSGKYMERFTKLVGLLNCDSHGNPINLASKAPSETSFTDTFSNYLAVKEERMGAAGLGPGGFEGPGVARWAGGVGRGGAAMGGRVGGNVGGLGEDGVYEEAEDDEGRMAGSVGMGEAGLGAAGVGGGRAGSGAGAGVRERGGDVREREGGRSEREAGRSGRHHHRHAEEDTQPREPRKLIVPCPPEMVKHIIGRGGETIRSLQASSGAHIFVNQDFPPNKDREVRIAGPSDCVDTAERMVIEIIGNGDNRGTQQVIQRVLGNRQDRGTDYYARGRERDRERERDYPERYRMASADSSRSRSPEPDRWAHDKFADDDRSARSDDAPPRKRRT